MNNNSRKKTQRILVALLTLALVGSTFATIASLRGGKSKQKENGKEVTQPINKEITEGLKKDMQNAKIEAGDKVVKATITITSEANKIQADKVADQLAKELKEKNKGKDVSVDVVYDGEKVSESNIYDTPKDEAKKDDNIPEKTITIKSGLTEMDRYVAITLKTDDPTKYSVEVMGQKLEYVPSKKLFHGVIQTTDENAIRSNVKVALKK
ncbi:hypothetical protein [Clostridium ganghwense]|uniref:Uncharacterized protein n=1 Tax=Clostridium ganghwense TaxID=312089 RepID=A0ABT4CPU0_9CLOT|nr:hypothetical protein [Clostridium ganghwense]MCY6370968.1 hypothetical protein [Clostridium ganghwense]